MEGGSEEITAGKESRRDLRLMLLIGGISSAIGIALALLIDWFPVQASEQGGPIDTMFDVLLIVSVPIFVLVQVVVLYCVARFRMKPGEELKDGPPIHGNTKLEIIWTAIPAIILVALCSYAYVVLRDIEEADAADQVVNVRVVGEQFTWTFYYQDPADRGREIASPQLYLPVGKQAYFTIQSKDVLHDFWVPAFRMKIDAVPGIDTHLRVTPTTEGRYPVVCAELCGLGHSVMRQTAHVESEERFQQRLQELAAPQGGEGAAGGGAGGGSNEPADGKNVFVTNNCGNCHTLADAASNGGAGPNLDDGLAGQSPEFIRESIVNPSAQIADGFSDGIMPPNYGDTIPGEQLDALVDYLAEVTSG